MILLLSLLLIASAFQPEPKLDRKKYFQMQLELINLKYDKR
jgi:hypothetical protein